METTATHPRPSGLSLPGRLVRITSLALTLVIVGIWLVLLRPSFLGGPTTYVIVAGGSMHPTLQSGDLVVAFEQDAYTVGDVVVYRVPAAERGAGTKIVHRIVGGSETGYVVKGDAREGPDKWEPTPDEILGKMTVNVPHAGSALLLLRTPLGLAFLAGMTTLLVALGVFSRPDRPASRTRSR